MLGVARMVGTKEVEVLRSEKESAVSAGSTGAGEGQRSKIETRTCILKCSMYTI